MADVSKTGKRIHELESMLENIKDDSYFPISQDSQTRRVPMRALRKFLNGDNDEPSDEYYYSSAKITELFDAAADEFNEIDRQINEINTNLIEISNAIKENYNTLDKRITELDKKLEGWILYGVEPPTDDTLPVGRLYIQYFPEEETTTADTETASDVTE